MTDSTESWVSDLKIAAQFVRSVRTGRPRIDIELQDLAHQIEEIVARQLVAKAATRRQKRPKKNRRTGVFLDALP